ncbi:MAG: OmpA family protein [Elusimicrobia bacterium]|nr:OmpA family protein [Elusimicrobiota bacterium]
MRFLAAVMLTILGAAPLGAEDLTGRFAAGGGVGAGVPVGTAWVSQHATIGPLVGGFLRYGVDKNLGLGFSYDNLGFGKGGIRVQPVLVNVYYNFNPGSPLNPNIHLGLGGADVRRNEQGRETTFANKLGVGVDYFVHNNVAVGGFMDYLLGWYKSGASHNTNHELHAMLFGASLSFWFGAGRSSELARAAAPELAPAPAPEIFAPAPVVAAAPAPAPEIPAPAPTPASAPIVVPPAQAEPVSVDLLIHFDPNMSVIKPQYIEKLIQAAELLKANPEARAEIEGYTDNQEGTPESNMVLSQRRADAVRWTMVSRYGAPRDRIQAKGYGRTKPIADNKTRAGRAQNRRVIATFTGI